MFRTQREIEKCYHYNQVRSMLFSFQLHNYNEAVIQEIQTTQNSSSTLWVNSVHLVPFFSLHLCYLGGGNQLNFPIHNCNKGSPIWLLWLQLVGLCECSLIILPSIPRNIYCLLLFLFEGFWDIDKLFPEGNQSEKLTSAKYLKCLQLLLVKLNSQ